MALEWDDAPADAAAPTVRTTRRPAWTLTSGERIGSADRVMFTERLTLLLETGVPLHDALRALHEQAGKPRLKAIVGEVADDIVGGQRFSEALARHPDLFPPTYINLIGASEEGGFLAEVLEQLVEMDEKQERLRSTIVSALSYPGFLIVFSVLVVVFILVAVFPKFSVMFTAIYDELPVTTKVFIFASELLTKHGAVFGIGTLALAAGALLALRRPDVREGLDRLKLRLPLVKDIFIKIYLTRLMRVMGISLDRGVTILATLGACRDVIPNAEFQRFIGELEVQVTEGRGIAAGFRDSPLIPVSVKQMIETGEQTGNLGRVMGRVADFYERDLTRQLNSLAKMAEPVMLLVMGVLVGTIVTSIILPIFKMSRAVH
ncbi:MULTISPECIES: type II secretion system F family protein [unclassified Massilia]|uniref:type II secretion system F family protein n=1 Tax=unclassified Massilia TaxID=2609279 RepID=UPI0017862BFC|nr:MULTISPECIES: type II secretion system F family protein [unclassified Massilia]MBD8531733.1 type II secretion system F family protein [Massilia sp. CFBP 13647]MBD8675178.1 type II secretion system F family protein [Massilia sp. CFBP 13721]